MSIGLSMGVGLGPNLTRFGPAINQVGGDLFLSNITDNGNGTYTMTAGVSATARFAYPLVSLQNGARYHISFTISVMGKTSIQTDFCDEAPSLNPSAAGNVSYVSSRSTYDSTYRFVDLAGSGAGIATFTAPVLRKVL
jgi:hypothetical protein